MLNNQNGVFLVRFQEFFIQEIFYPLIFCKILFQKILNSICLLLLHVVATAERKIYFFTLINR